MAFTPVFYTYLPLSGERGRKELAELKGTMFNPTLQPPSSRLTKSNFYFGSSDAGAARFHCFPTSGRLSFRSFFLPETYLPVPFLSDSFVGRIFHARNVFAANIVNAFVAPKSWSCPLSREWITISPGYSARAFHRVPSSFIENSSKRAASSGKVSLWIEKVENFSRHGWSREARGLIFKRVV